MSKGSYLKRETKEYVPKLLAAAIIAKEPAKYGFADIAYLPPIEFDTVTIPSRTDLEVVARLAGINYDDLRELNPELRRWCTPPNYPGYQLKVPKGSGARFAAEFAKLPEDQRFQERISYARYKVKRKESLATVAKRFNTSVEALTELNQLKANASLRGKTLVVPVQIAAAGGQPDRSNERSARKSASVFNKYYTVKRGDTLVSVAKRFNVSTKVLAAWNNLTGKVALKPGRRIVVAKFTEKKDGALVPVHEKS
jgi:membrane-bound lytic murein transglycosylase D